MADLIIEMTPAGPPDAYAPSSLLGLTNEVYDALGKTNLQWRRSVTDLINDWIQKLANLHAWQWRQEYVELDTVADQEFINLPGNFAKTNWVRPKASTVNAMPLSWSELQLRRATTTGLSSVSCYFAARWLPQAGTATAPLARLEIWPAPAEAIVGYLAVSYDRLLPPLADNAHVPDVPTWMHPLIRQFVRAEALRYDDQVESWARERDELASMMPDYLGLDGQLQTDGAGRVVGAVMQQTLGGRLVPPHNSISV